MLSLLLFAEIVVGQAPQVRTFSVDQTRSKIHYFIDHTMHKVEGECVAMEGKLVGRPDGLAQLMVRAQVANFRSGDANRDAHMQEVVQAAQYPAVIFKSATRVEPKPPQAPVDLKLAGELEFHGQKRSETIPVRVELTPEGALHVTGSFTVSLEAYGIERPSLFFVKLKDACRIDFSLMLTESRS